jgi:hypothetical protein
LKLLPATDKTIYNLLNAYFNLSPSRVYNTNNMSNRLKRLSMIRIFIGKPEMKHNNNKVIITVYTYNRKKVYLLIKIKKLLSTLNLTQKNLGQKTLNIRFKKLFQTLKLQKEINKKDSFFLNHLTKKSVSSLFLFFRNKVITDQVRITNPINNSLTIINENMYINKVDKPGIINNISFNKKAELKNKFLFGMNPTTLKIQLNLRLIYSKLKRNILKHAKNNTKLLSYLDLSLRSTKFKKGFSYKYYCSMLYFNNYIFNTNNILPLKEIIKKIYMGSSTKKVEVNIINLKYLYLDSNIFAEAITRKLKDRQKRVLRVLKLGLKLTKKPYFKIHFHKDNIKLNFMFCDKKLDLRIKSHTLVTKNNTA